MKNVISGFKVLTEKPCVNNLLEFEMDVPQEAEMLNVYKKDEVDITLKMVSASGNIISADAFYYEEYLFAEDGEIKTRTEKNPCFRIRVMPTKEGKWSYTVSLKIKNENKDTLTGCIDIYKSEKESRLLSIEPIRKQVFATSSGEPVIMIGENLNYNNPISDKNCFAKYITENMKILAHNGANHVRIFDKIESGSQIRDGVYNMSQAASAMWDRIFFTADELGMYVSFVTVDFWELTQNIFQKSCWNKENGGYITSATEFFSNSETKEAYKEYLRYIVSRFGYSESLFTWELFNEVDRTDAMNEGRYKEISEWLYEMAAYIKEMNINNHLVSNSIFFTNLIAAFYKPFDFIYFHQCNNASVSYLAEIQKSFYGAYERPAINGDGGVVGATAALCGDSITEDLTVVHQGNWAGVMGCGAGTVMNNSWHRLSQLKGEWCYKAVSEIAKRIPWCDKKIKSVTFETVKPSNSQISLLGYMGDNYAYLWLYDNHLMPINRKETLFENETVSMKIENGSYTVSWINTRSGEEVKCDTVLVSGNILSVNMPIWSKDIALVVELVR